MNHSQLFDELQNPKYQGKSNEVIADELNEPTIETEVDGQTVLISRAQELFGEPVTALDVTRALLQPKFQRVHAQWLQVGGAINNLFMAKLNDIDAGTDVTEPTWDDLRAAWETEPVT